MLEEGYCPQWQTYNWIWVGKIFSILVEMGQQLLLLYPIRSHIQRKKYIYILTTNLPSNKPWNKKRNAHKTCVKINSFNVQQKRKILKFWCWTICDYEKKGKVKTGEDVFQGLKNNWKKKKVDETLLGSWFTYIGLITWIIDMSAHARMFALTRMELFLQ